MTSQVAKWRVGERRVPQSRHDLARHVLLTKEAHPLAITTSFASFKPVNRVLPSASPSSPFSDSFSSKESGTGASQELVVLQDGDMDPLGVFLSSTTATHSESTDMTLFSKPSDLVYTSPIGTSSTVKHKWKEHTDRLLAKYADHTFKIKASMLEVNELENEISFVPKRDYQMKDDLIEASVITKTRTRLELLDRGPEKNRSLSEQDDETIEISHSQYVAKVKEMQKKLITSWKHNYKVEALRIAIKCVKLLADIDTAPQLYPCVFVLVSEVLDTFGKLVFDRIHARASEDENGLLLSELLGEHFTSSDINEQATETCRNWFYKSACIRELLPRIGVGEPMVSLYARLYLSLTSSELLGASSPADQTVVVSSSLFDYFYAFNWFRQHKLEHWLRTHKMEYGEYLALHSPAVEWLFQCVAPGASQGTFDSLLAHSQQYFDSSMVLKHLCEYLGAQFYASTPTKILELIRTFSSSLISKCHLYSLVAVQLSNVPEIAENESGGKLQFLNSSWSSITSQEDITQYMECAAAYMKLIVAHFSHREALILLKDVVRHLNAATLKELTAKTYNLLGALIENVVFGAKQHYEFFSKLIPSTPFLTLLGMFKQESSVNVAKKVLRAFVGGNMKKSSNRSCTLRLHVVGPEAAVAHTLLVVCCRVHDALNSLSTVSEHAEASRDISAFITRLGYVNESSAVSERAQNEKQEALLMLYTDCRRAFYKLDQIKILLITMVLRLAMHAHKRISGNVVLAIGSKKRAHACRSLIQSCLAFAHVTVPSIDTPLEKLQLMVLAANVALVTSCIPQMDAMVKAAIVMLADFDLSAVRPSFSCDTNLGMVTSSAPIHAAAVGLFGVVGTSSSSSYKIDEVMSVVGELLFWSGWHGFRGAHLLSLRLEAGVARVRVLLMLAKVYALWAQQSLPGRLDGVDSNDVLYGGDDAFYNEVQVRFSSVVEEVARDIEALGEPSHGNDNAGSDAAERVMVAQIELMLDFVNLVVPMLEYVESRFGETTDSSRDNEFTDNSRSGSRQRKKSRSGIALVRKCMTYSYVKAKLLKQAKPRDMSTSQSQVTTWICRYFDSTRVYIIDLMLEMSKRAGGIHLDATSQQSIKTLADTMQQLAL
ncbi:unnamed protein product [Peronospora destructor]|uniref:Uncharacterized protein n=1 Tax=Peronospora destructor TaxID=86335 RepID=A0AAV0U956_9STRA|nr:unnamed protein product [Peronospora destructor]